MGGTIDKIGRGVGSTVKKAVGDVSAEAKRNGRAVDRNTRRLGREAERNTRRLGREAERNIRRSVGRTVEDIAEEAKRSAVYKWLVANLAKLFMDRPQITPIKPDFPGKPIYYVNGMLTPLNQAIAEGEQLALQMARALGSGNERPVWLIHNPTMLSGSTGSGSNIYDDVSEAIYDRTWPALFAGQLVLTPQTLTFRQLNTTTRQLTHLLYHAKGPISIVTHSQGCLQMRNAVMTSALFAGKVAIAKRVRWVAAGLPLNNNEIWPRLGQFHAMKNPGDFVAQLIGLQGGSRMAEAVRNPHHAFISQYLPAICENPQWLAN